MPLPTPSPCSLPNKTVNPPYLLLIIRYRSGVEKLEDLFDKIGTAKKEEDKKPSVMATFVRNPLMAFGTDRSTTKHCTYFIFASFY